MVADRVPAGAAVADIGAGDAQLCVHLARRGDCRRLIAVELNAGSLLRARERLAGLPVEVRQGDGLAALAEHEVEVAVMAGMGGRLMARILAASPGVAAALDLLLLQPMQGLEELQAALSAGPFGVVESASAVQAGRRYTLLVVRPQPDASR